MEFTNARFSAAILQGGGTKLHTVTSLQSNLIGIIGAELGLFQTSTRKLVQYAPPFGHYYLNVITVVQSA